MQIKNSGVTKFIAAGRFSGSAGTGAGGGGSVTEVSATGASAAVLAGLRGAFSFLIEILAIKILVIKRLDIHLPAGHA